MILLPSGVINDDDNYLIFQHKQANKSQDCLNHSLSILMAIFPGGPGLANN